MVFKSRQSAKLYRHKEQIERIEWHGHKGPQRRHAFDCDQMHASTAHSTGPYLPCRAIWVPIAPNIATRATRDERRAVSDRGPTFAMQPEIIQIARSKCVPLRDAGHAITGCIAVTSRFAMHSERPETGVCNTSQL